MSVFPTRHQTERTTTDSIRAADAILASGVQLLTFVWYDSVPTTSRCAPRIISPDSSECLVTLPHWLHQQRPRAPVHLRGVHPVYDVDPPNVVPRERSFVKSQEVLVSRLVSFRGYTNVRNAGRVTIPIRTYFMSRSRPICFVCSSYTHL